MHGWHVRLDKGTYIIGAAAVAVAIVLGVLAGAWPGALAALAGLASTALWEIAADRRTRVRARGELLDDAARDLVPPGQATRGAAQYLRPEAEVVRFWPRPELAELHAWEIGRASCRERV